MNNTTPAVAIVRDEYTTEDYHRIHKIQMDMLSVEERKKQENEIEFANRGVVKSLNDKMNMIRAKRDELLASSDFYFITPDIIMDNDKKNRIIKYREALRAFPNTIVNGICNNKHILAMTNEELLSYLPKLDP